MVIVGTSSLLNHWGLSGEGEKKEGKSVIKQAADTSKGINSSVMFADVACVTNTLPANCCFVCIFPVCISMFVNASFVFVCFLLTRVGY